LGDRWSLIVIRDLMFGNRRHFRELLTRSEELSVRAKILEDGDPKLWSEFMEELQHLHLEAPAPRGAVFSSLQSAYEAASAKPLV